MADRLYFRQLLAGRDFAKDDQVAHQMVNFVYLIGDTETREAVAVDPAYAIDDLLDTLAGDGMRLTGVLATHYHPDHVGGSLGGFDIEGIVALLDRQPVKIHINAAEAEWVRMMTGVDDTDLQMHEGGDVVEVGQVPIQLLHTPGHTPGSQCFLVDGRLVSGDTLFLDGCGRTDLPGADVGDMFDSLQRLVALPADTVVFPGHRYAPEPSADMAEVKARNYVLKPTSKQQWLRMFGAA
ncbi:MAG: MBL fold metallo-hydrolase [Acidimicrobiales bacterium]